MIVKNFKTKGIVLASFLLLFCFSFSYAQQEQSAEVFQKELDEFYKNPEESPLKSKAKEFKGHKFFPINDKLRIEAKFTRTLNALPFHMKTTTNRLPVYEKYGEVAFKIDGQEMSLTLYQGHATREKEEYKDNLFLPFTDMTNGAETYQGGRFIDMQIPEGDRVYIDFNKAYNPYCAYNANYSCPIPPKENDLNVRIEAGVKYEKINDDISK